MSSRRRTSWVRRTSAAPRRWRTCGLWWGTGRLRETTWPSWCWSDSGTSQTPWCCASSERASLTWSEPTSSWRVSYSGPLITTSTFSLCKKNPHFLCCASFCPEAALPCSNNCGNWGWELIYACVLHEFCLWPGGMCSLTAAFRCSWQSLPLCPNGTASHRVLWTHCSLPGNWCWGCGHKYYSQSSLHSNANMLRFHLLIFFIDLYRGVFICFYRSFTLNDFCPDLKWNEFSKMGLRTIDLKYRCEWALSLNLQSLSHQKLPGNSELFRL